VATSLAQAVYLSGLGLTDATGTAAPAAARPSSPEGKTNKEQWQDLGKAEYAYDDDLDKCWASRLSSWASCGVLLVGFGSESNVCDRMRNIEDLWLL